MIGQESNFLSTIITRTFNIDSGKAPLSRLEKAIEKANKLKEKNPDKNIALDVSITDTKAIQGEISGIKSQTKDIQESIHLVKTLGNSFQDIGGELNSIKKNIELIQDASTEGLSQDEINQAIQNVVESLNIIDEINTATQENIHLQSTIITDPFNLKISLGNEFVDIHNIVQPTSSEALGLKVEDLNVEDKDSLENLLAQVATATENIESKQTTTEETMTLIENNISHYILSGSITNIHDVIKSSQKTIETQSSEAIAVQSQNLTTERALNLVADTNILPSLPPEKQVQVTPSKDEFPPSLETILKDLSGYPPEKQVQVAQTKNEFPPSLETILKDLSGYPPEKQVQVAQTKNEFPPSLETILQDLSGYPPESSHQKTAKTESFPPSLEDIIQEHTNSPSDFNKNLVQPKKSEELPSTPEKISIQHTAEVASDQNLKTSIQFAPLYSIAFSL